MMWEPISSDLINQLKILILMYDRIKFLNAYIEDLFSSA